MNKVQQLLGLIKQGTLIEASNYWYQDPDRGTWLLQGVDPHGKLYEGMVSELSDSNWAYAVAMYKNIDDQHGQTLHNTIGVANHEQDAKHKIEAFLHEFKAELQEHPWAK